MHLNGRGKQGEGDSAEEGRPLVKFKTNSTQMGLTRWFSCLFQVWGAGTSDQYANMRNPFIFTCVYVCVGVRVWDLCFSLLLLSWANKRRTSCTKAACLHTNFYWLFLFVLNSKYREAGEAGPFSPSPLRLACVPFVAQCKAKYAWNFHYLHRVWHTTKDKVSIKFIIRHVNC